MFDFLYEPPSKSLNYLSSKGIPTKTFQVSFGQNVFQRFFDKESPSVTVAHLNTYPKQLPDDIVRVKYRKSPHKKRSL